MNDLLNTFTMSGGGIEVILSVLQARHSNQSVIDTGMVVNVIIIIVFYYYYDYHYI